MTAPTVNWSIDVGNMLVMAGGILSFLWGAITVRDSLRDMRTSIGQRDPRSGILGTLEDHDDDLKEHGKAIIRTRQILIEMNALAPEPQRARIERT